MSHCRKCIWTYARSRPFDDQDEMRIRLETSAVDLILSYARSGNLQLVVSPVHDVVNMPHGGTIKYENTQLPVTLQGDGQLATPPLSIVRAGLAPAHAGWRAIFKAEIGAISHMEERRQLELMLEQIGARPTFDLMSARQRAEALVGQGVGVADAAHLAFAEQIRADFVTCDDRLLRQCRRVGVEVWAGTPPAYCDKENLR